MPKHPIITMSLMKISKYILKKDQIPINSRENLRKRPLNNII